MKSANWIFSPRALFLAALLALMGAVPAAAQVSLLEKESDLIIAVREGNLALAKERFIAGDSANGRSRDYIPALVIAAARGDAAMTRLLLDNGAWPSVPTPRGQTALTEAAFRGHVAIAAALLEAGAKPNQRGPSREPPLMLAVRGGRLEVAKLLLAHGADPTVRDLTGRSMEEIARRARRKDMEQLLRGGTSPPSAPGTSGY